MNLLSSFKLAGRSNSKLYDRNVYDLVHVSQREGKPVQVHSLSNLTGGVASVRDSAPRKLSFNDMSFACAEPAQAWKEEAFV